MRTDPARKAKASGARRQRAAPAPSPMEREEIVTQALAAWRRHNDILLYLLDKIPSRGLAATPAGSRGRDVARQFAHVDRVRRGWLHVHRTGKRPRLPRVDRGPAPTRSRLRAALRESGRQVETFLQGGFAGEVRPRMFGREVMRWMGYLIAHESHHRGQIVLALKQSGMRLPESIAVQGLWGRWIFGA